MPAITENRILGAITENRITGSIVEGATIPFPANWILTTGFWDDAAVWDDSDVWID